MKKHSTLFIILILCNKNICSDDGRLLCISKNNGETKIQITLPNSSLDKISKNPAVPINKNETFLLHHSSELVDTLLWQRTEGKTLITYKYKKTGKILKMKNG